MPFGKRGLKREDILYYVACVAILAVSALAFFYVGHTTNTQTYEQLVRRVQSVATVLEPAEMSQLTLSEADLDNPVYILLKKKITALKDANKDLRFAYLMAMRNGRVYFMLDSEDPSSEDYSPPGQEYVEASPALINGWNPNVPFVLEIYADRWGNWISALAPVVNASGTTVALIGFDQNADTHRLVFYLQSGLVLLATIALLSLVSMLYVFNKREQDLVKMKEDFVAVASHELRSPLASLRWSLSTLRLDTSLRPEMRDTLNDIYLRICSLIDLTSTFLLTTSADHGLMRRADFKPVNVARVLRSAIADGLSLGKAKNITIQSDIGPDTSAMVMGDAEKLRLVFDNLLSNAVKYSPPGSVVSISYVDDQTSRMFQVHNRGISISKTDLDSIFKGFRGTNAEESGAMGTGFGLYISKKIVDFHRGTITCNSSEANGTTFTVTLPANV